MPWDAPQFQAILDALRDQGYRRIGLDGINPDVRLPSSGDAAVDSALIGARETPNWGEIGRQLVQLSKASGYQAILVRRDRNDLEVVVVQTFARSPLYLVTAEREMTHNWTVVDQLGKFVEQFRFSADTAKRIDAVLGGPAKADAAVAAAPEDPNLDAEVRAKAAAERQQQQATSAAEAELDKYLIALAVIRDVALAKSTTGVGLLIGADGVGADLAGRLKSSWIKKSVSISQRTLACVALDCRTHWAHGHTMLGSLNVDRLGQSYKYALRIPL